MENGQLVPELRFPEFDEDWEKKELKSIVQSVDYRGRGPTKSDSGVFLVTAKNIKKGFIDYNSSKEYIPSENYDLVMSKGKPKVGDIVFTTEAPMGNVAVLDKEKIALAQRVIKFRVKEQLNNMFLLFNLLCPETQKKLSRLSIGSTVKGISNKDLHKVKIAFPKNFQEQKIIANFLTAIDQRITQLKQKKAALEQYKKGLMQKIFSQEVRFKDDEGNVFPDWDEKMLGDMATFSKGKGLSKSDISDDGENKCIRYGQLYTCYSEVIDIVHSKTNLALDKCVLSQKNDVIIPSSGETKLDIATASCVLKEGIILGGDLNIIRSKVNGVFLAYYLNNFKKHDIAKLSQGISVVHLYSTHLSQLKLEIPCLKEQQKIANFLSVIDKKIYAMDKQITDSELFKKGLLQRMFV